MSEWLLLDWDRELATPTSAEQLERELATLREKVDPPNTIVNLVSPMGDTLSVGVASERDEGNESVLVNGPVACMNYMHDSRNPPYLKVVGDPSLTDDEVVVFTYEEQWTEIPCRNCVPVDIMVRAASDFFRTGTLPSWLAWEEV